MASEFFCYLAQGVRPGKSRQEFRSLGDCHLGEGWRCDRSRYGWTPPLNSGTQEIYSGTQEIYSGTQEIYSGTQELYSGTREVYSGTKSGYHG